MSERTAFLVNFGGGDGTLCLGGDIGRFVSEVGDSGPSGTVGIHVDLTALPPPAQQVVLPGQIWHFQARQRDVDAAQATSNFTDALSLSFQ